MDDEKPEVPNITPKKRGTDARPHYYALFRYQGKQHCERTGAHTLAEFDKVKKRLQEQLAAGTWVPAAKRTQTADASGEFAAFAMQVHEQRVRGGVKSAAKDERIMLEKHLIPEFGSEPLAALVSYTRVADGFKRIAAKPGQATRGAGATLSGSRVNNIYIVFQTIMRLAMKRGLVDTMAPTLTVRDGELPPIVDTREDGWRDQALFTLPEIRLILGAESIELQYRVMYAVWFLTGSRFAEVCGLRISDYCRTTPKLGMLTIKANKQRRSKGARYRTPPVHPDLALWLDWWIDQGYELVHLRKPQPDSWLFPSFSPRRRTIQTRKTAADPTEVQCSHGEVYKRWQRHHLPELGLRHRRMHDMRRTLLSVIRSAGAAAEIARSFTHSVIADKVLDAYTTFEWASLCEAMLKLSWDLPKPPSLEPAAAVAEVVQLHQWSTGKVGHLA